MSTDNIEIVKNADVALWKRTVQVIVNELNWAIHLDDYEIWLKSFPKGQFIAYFAVDKDTGLAAGMLTVTTSTIRDPDDGAMRHLAFIGLFYVRREYRSQGIGNRLFDAALAEAGTDVSLLGVEAMWEKYRDRRDFSNVSDYRVIWDCASCHFARPELLHAKYPPADGVRIIDYEPRLLDAVEAFDTSVSGGALSRRVFIATAFANADATVKVALDASGDVVGVCRFRRVISDNFDVGPFYATSKLVAANLLAAAVEAARPRFAVYSKVYFKFPSTNSDALDLFHELIDHSDYEEQFSIPLYTRKPIAVATKNVYSLFDADTMFI